MGVTHRTAEIYRQVGLLEAIEKGSLSLEGRSLAFWAKSLVGETLGEVPLHEAMTPVSPSPVLHCPQTWVEEVLLEAVHKEPLAEVRFSTEVSSVEQGECQVTVQLANGERLSASWLIAADGAGSRVRKSLYIDTDGPGDMGHFINTLFRAPYGKRMADRKSLLYQSLSDEYFEAFVAVNGDDLWLMHHFLQPGESAADFSAEQMAEIIRYTSGMPEEPVEVLGMSPWVMSPKVAKQWRAGRIFLTGDASARLSPAGGLGLNTGLQSVHNLAWKLAAVVKGEAADQLLDTYQQERQGAAYWLMNNTNRNAEEIMTIIASAMRKDWEHVRDLIAHSRRGGAGLGQDLGISFTGGAFLPDGTSAPAVADAINDYVPTARPGSRAPHVVIRFGEAEKSTLDLFGDGFCVLAGRAGGAWRGGSSGLKFYENGADFEAQDFEAAYGIQPNGAVLVRPDGFVAARFASYSGDSIDLSEVVKKLLG